MRPLDAQITCGHQLQECAITLIKEAVQYGRSRNRGKVGVVQVRRANIRSLSVRGRRDEMDTVVINGKVAGRNFVWSIWLPEGRDRTEFRV